MKLKGNSGIGNDVSWKVLFIVTLWQIWKDRNRKSFDNIDNVAQIEFQEHQ